VLISAATSDLPAQPIRAPASSEVIRSLDLVLRQSTRGVACIVNDKDLPGRTRCPEAERECVLMVGDRATYDSAAVGLGIVTLLLPPLRSVTGYISSLVFLGRASWLAEEGAEISDNNLRNFERGIVPTAVEL
jgi:hypothetical protein